jgi:hypothetical protein
MADESSTIEGLAEKQELVKYCEVSRDQRRVTCDLLRMMYERGSDEGPRAAVNEIQSHVDRVGSYLFAPDTMRLGAAVPRHLRKDWLGAAQAARDEVQQTWHDAGVDQVFMLLLEWALVYGSTVGKLQHDPETGFRVGYIQPWDFGVSREGVPRLDEQDTMAHWYALSMPQVERWLVGQKREDALLAIAREHQRKAPNQTRQGLIVSNISGVFPGSNVNATFQSPPDSMADEIMAQEDEPIVPFVDLWERKRFRRRTMNDQKKGEVFEDWLVTTLVADASHIFAERRNPVLPWTRVGKQTVLHAEHPFVMVTPRPVPDYLWGRSEVASLRRLQIWLMEHLEDTRRIIRRKLDPSKFFSGIPDAEEAGRAMSTDGGSYASPEPGARMETIKVDLGPEVFEFEKLLERKFGEVSGIPQSLTEPGTTPGGVRSEGHFGMAASIGAGRILRMARITEDPLGQIASKGFHITQRHDTQMYERADGPSFLLSQIPPGLTFHVNSHSASPIFMEQTKQDGMMLHKAGEIRGEDLIEMVNPPNKDELKEHARELDKAKAERAEKMMEIQELKATKGGRVGRPPK